jgi:hypothetical protein
MLFNMPKFKLDGRQYLAVVRSVALCGRKNVI